MPMDKKTALQGGAASVKHGAEKRSRTPDLRITNALLYQLSYFGDFIEVNCKFKPDMLTAPRFFFHCLADMNCAPPRGRSDVDTRKRSCLHTRRRNNRLRIAVETAIRSN